MQTQATQASPALVSASQTQSLQAHATALLRVSLGIMALAHGLLKVFVFTVPGTVGFFESLGLPAFIAYLTILAEVGGGLALVLGIYTRWVSLALVPILLGAAWAHAGNGWVFSNPGGGWEYPVFWTVTLLVQAGLGSGSFVVSRRFA
ncbi:DoxX family protein [Billgrantia pellis]|uniref:DoxX family protein n=1 Tax=Billgrantia pellis TaxID=2606936 RepID=A0A7V7G0B5_9GAMM|nr:DoxX family protein [Halomonas pellis]KAA0010373.1 DoxX family protein [Halomonas pellis]